MTIQIDTEKFIQRREALFITLLTAHLAGPDASALDNSSELLRKAEYLALDLAEADAYARKYGPALAQVRGLQSTTGT